MSESRHHLSLLLWQQDMADRLEVLDRDNLEDRRRAVGSWLVIIAIGLVAEVAGPGILLVAAYPTLRLCMIGLRRRARDRESEVLQTRQRWISRWAV